MIWNRRKTLVTTAAAVAVAALAAGGIAVAHAQDTGQSTPSATSTASPGTGPTGKAGKGTHKGRADLQAVLTKLKDVQHAQWVTKDGANATFVTHDLIRGAVTAVSSTSLTVKAGDGVSQTYTLGSKTKISLRGGKGTKASTGAATDLKTGGTVVVTGTGTSTLTADRVLVQAG